MGRSTRLSLKQDAENSHRLKDPSSCLLTITLSNSFLPHLPQSLVTTNLLFLSQMSREQNRTDASSQPGLAAQRAIPEIRAVVARTGFVPTLAERQPRCGRTTAVSPFACGRTSGLLPGWGYYR